MSTGLSTIPPPPNTHEEEIMMPSRCEKQSGGAEGHKKHEIRPPWEARHGGDPETVHHTCSVEWEGRFQPSAFPLEPPSDFSS